MAEKDVEEAAKKPNEDGQDPTSETILEEKSSSGGDGGQASDSIRYFVRDRLQDFYSDMEQAIDNFESHMAGQQDDFKIAFNQRGFFSFLGDRFEEELFHVAGGAKPLMTALVGEVDMAAGNAEHSSQDLSVYINNALRRGTRDACWFVRDACPGLLAGQWKQLESLAANGSDQFIPVLHQLGLPSIAFNPAEFTQRLIHHSDSYRRSIGLKQREIEDSQKDQGQDKQAEEQKEAAKQEMQQDEGTKQQSAGA